MTIQTYEFQQSSEGSRERTFPVPWTRLADQTPTKGDAARVTGLVAGRMMCGTVYEPGSTADPYAVINFAMGRVELKDVRNVLTYTAGPVAEATWGPINFGDPIFYDDEQDTLNGIKLSTSPLQSDGATANEFWGWAVTHEDETIDDFPKGGETASTQEVTILCAGLSD